MARRLAEQGRRVVIFEQGPAISDPAGSHIRNASRFRTDPDAYLALATSYLDYFDPKVARDKLPGAAITSARGGQGVLWTNLCPRGDAPWNALADVDWDKYYGVAEQYLGVQSEEFESSVRQKKIRSSLEPHLARSGRRICALPVAAQFGAAGYLQFVAPYDIIAQSSDDAAARILVTQGTVNRLVTRGSKVTGVTIGTETIETEEVVVAAGAIGTPQLLHRSGIRPPALGRWLSYHPILISQLVLNHNLCAGPGVADREPRLQIPPTNGAECFSLVLRDVSPFQPTDPDLTIDANCLVEMQMLCPVDVNERNGIHFDEQSRPTFEVPLSAADEARLTNAEADANALASLLGRYRSGCRPIWMPFGFAHMTGTTRMSAEDNGTGVTDFQGRVWGFENLHLATNGLIPTRMAVNPTLTGVAISIRIADAIVSD